MSIDFKLKVYKNLNDKKKLVRQSAGTVAVLFRIDIEILMRLLGDFIDGTMPASYLVAR